APNRALPPLPTRRSSDLNAFLRQYPNSRYAGNAQYWLGEVSLVQGRLEEAGQAFAKVSHAYPKHNKVPDSLYKLAPCYVWDKHRSEEHTSELQSRENLVC